MALRLTDTDTFEAWLAETSETVQHFVHEVGALPGTVENVADHAFARGMSAMLTRVTDMLNRCTVDLDGSDVDQT